MIKSGDWIEYDTGERGVVRLVLPGYEYQVEFAEKSDCVAWGAATPIKPTFDDIARWAVAKGMRLERGSAERTRGARSGYVLWTRRGTWLRVGTLKEAFAYIERHA